MNAYSELNHGRWIVKCPQCTNAFLEAQVPDECPSCFVHPIDVIAPSKEQRKQIEDVVAGRPEENRNWVPGEPIDHLKADNVVHAVDNT